MYIRFIINEQDEESHRPQGAFTAGNSLVRSGLLSQDEEMAISNLFKWFNQHLPLPDKKYPKHTIYWFKGSNQEMVHKMWELVALLKVHDVPVAHITTERPGYIMYEDECQVGAIPFKDSIC